MKYLVFAILSNDNVFSRFIHESPIQPSEYDCDDFVNMVIAKAEVKEEDIHQIFVYASAQNFGDPPKEVVSFNSYDIRDRFEDEDNDHEEDDEEEEDDD